jgi:TonB family protein
MNVFLSTDDSKQDIIIAWTAAVLIHVLFFSLTGKIFINPPQFAIAPSREIDIDLMDAPKEIVRVKEQPKPVIKKVEKIIPKVLIKPRQIITSSGQVKAEAKPDYTQNPPPSYPELAKQMRQEGLVMLSVDVDRQGDPVKVDIIQSSGYRLLDQAALSAVSHWKFQPGSIGGITVNSTVTVPIRFQLVKS